MSLEMTITATPRSASAEQPVDFRLGADIDAARGFIHDEYLRFQGQPFAQDDFLLVSAAEVHHARFYAGRANAQGIHLAAGGGGFGASADEGGMGVVPQAGQGDIFANGHGSDESGFSAVLGNEENSGGDRVAGMPDMQRRPVEHKPAAQQGPDSEDGFNQFGPARADESGDAEDFPAAGLETDRAPGPGRGADACGPETRRVALAGAGDVKTAEVAADHQPNHVLVRDLCAG